MTELCEHQFKTFYATAYLRTFSFMNSLLRVLQFYNWIENKINTIVKRNTRRTQIKKIKKTENTQKY